MKRNSDFQSCAHTCAFSQVLRSALRRMPSVTTCASACTASSWSEQAKRRVVEVVTSGMERNSEFQPCAHTCAFSQVLRSALRRMPSVPTCASAYTASSWSGQAQRRVVEVATSGMESKSDFQPCTHTCALRKLTGLRARLEIAAALHAGACRLAPAPTQLGLSWSGRSCAAQSCSKLPRSGMEPQQRFRKTCAKAHTMRFLDRFCAVALRRMPERYNLLQLCAYTASSWSGSKPSVGVVASCHAPACAAAQQRISSRESAYYALSRQVLRSCAAAHAGA